MAVVAFTVAIAVHAPPAMAAGTFDVRTYGATGDGSSNDTPAINRAIAAANAAGGGTVRFTSGTYRSANSIHMLSNVTLQLDGGSTILGAPGTGYDLAEPNPNAIYVDYGHGHFHDAMIWGDRLSNIGFTGSGTIDGGGNLKIHEYDLPGPGEADKIISLTRCSNLTLSGITLRRGGHFAALINGCRDVTSHGLKIDTASDRDGWNIINTQNVNITDIDIAGQDDALGFKSDWALGQSFPNGHVRVDGAKLSAVCCNALMFGSETCSDFSDYTFDNITITGGNKAGLGLVSLDGAHISDVHYRNVTMSGVASPIFVRIGERKPDDHERCGNDAGLGGIRDITYDNVTATGKGPQTPTLWGADADHRVSDVTLNDVDITMPGGSANIGTGVPAPTDQVPFNPGSLGTRPSYGWYLHNVNGIHFTGGSTRFASNDDRPAVIADAARSVTFDHLTAQAGRGAPYDVRFQAVSGYCVSNSVNPAGQALRVTQTGSTRTCTGPPTITGLTVADPANAADWSVQSDFRSGVTQFGDRSYTVGAVPAALTGGQWIRSANDSRSSTTNPLVRFTVNRQATVAVAVDTRLGRLTWMDSGWSDSGTRITNSESPSRSFEVYTKVFPAGQVSLGPNGGGTRSMYTVVVT